MMLRRAVPLILVACGGHATSPPVEPLAPAVAPVQVQVQEPPAPATVQVQELPAPTPSSDGRCDPMPHAGDPCRAEHTYCVLSWGEPGGWSSALWCRDGRWQIEEERNLP